MKKKMTLLITMAILSAATTYGAIGDVWDLGDDYSDVNNPNGPWSYRNVSTNTLLLATPQIWGSSPDAWSTNGAMGGAWYFRPDEGQFGAEPNDSFVAASGAKLRWTSPIIGWIQVSGSIWGIWGGTTWSVQKNGVTIGSGGTAVSGTTNRTFFGGDALKKPVVIGDFIDFYPGASGSGGTYKIEEVAPPPTVNLTVVVSPAQVDTVVPAPGVSAQVTGSEVLLEASRYVDCPEVYVFDHWIGDVDDVFAAQTTITMNTDETVTAVFVDGRVCGDECHPYLLSGFDEDCDVDLEDFANVAGYWLACTKPECD